MSEHDCKDHIVYLETCYECREKDVECPLSVKGICSVCGEVVE